ncbi:MAG: molybdopterin-dependent oxidoreductase [Bacteroidetes bacterium]|nr:molybdopterin-dependent oxidoreductase [Bacteroidota bacterium]MBU1423267.1 molybdopterin-dependent oxidoreductase [Bacteroidota bacterium]
MKKNISHESSTLHVTGEAVYIDDILVNEQLLVGKVVYSPHAHARIKSFDLNEAKKVPGVHAVLCYRDIPGHNQMGPVVKDEPVLTENEVTSVGQAMFLIAAETEEQCREAEKLIRIEYEPLEAILDIETAIAKNNLLGPVRRMNRGDADAALKIAKHVISDELRTGAQEHWYLETQACLCIPGEGKEINVFSSSQHPSETQTLVAEVLGINRNEVVVEVRRMGGGFGGKETQANHVACWSALLCNATKRPVKIRLFRDDDMIMTGKRHRYITRYEVGFDDEGVIQAVSLEFNSDGGAATDLSFAIMGRTMLHADNAYFVPNMSVTANVWKTNLPSNTAFRGFGGPQGMAAMETVIDRVARYLHKDPTEIRYKNFYGIEDRNITHYGQTVEHNRLFLLYNELMKSSEYEKRRKEIDVFNTKNEFYKKGLALTPVKFGISFTTTFLNQAGALVNVYTDGTVLVNHGGTEMGQGLNTKIQQIAAAEFGVSIEKVKVNATNTSKIPNTSATAASSGSDMNGMAVKNAIDTIKDRISKEVAKIFNEQYSTDINPTIQQSNIPRPNDEGGRASFHHSICFKDDFIIDSDHPDRRISFADAMKQMNLRQVSLSATGFYKTPTIGWDKIKGQGKPFFYYSFGMAVSEVLIDMLTGQHMLLRTDIVQDAGDSINPGIDIGQVEGGFVQGVGWVTTEEIKWDTKGNLMTHSSDTYKIPTVQDIPKDFRVKLLENVPNPIDTIRRSKAVGEPPFMLSLSVWLAIKDAISSVADHKIEPDFLLPATNEIILLSIEKLRKVKIKEDLRELVK